MSTATTPAPNYTAAPTAANTPRPAETPSTTTTTQPPLPSANTFEILPPLHALLSRLEPATNIYTPTASTASANGSESNAALNYKDVSTTAQFLKTRIRKAVAACEGLEDMERSTQEQEEEIEALERRIRGQREVLARLGAMARGMEGGG